MFPMLESFELSVFSSSAAADSRLTFSLANDAFSASRSVVSDFLPALMRLPISLFSALIFLFVSFAA